MSTRSKSIFMTKMLLNTCLSFMTNVSANKAPNNIACVCKSHYIDCLIKELGIDTSVGNPTYTPTTLTKEEVLNNHRSVLYSFGISTKDEELDLPSLLLDSKITQVSFQTGLYCWVCQMLHETSIQIINIYSIGGQNWASELLWHYSKDLLEYIQFRFLS